MAVVGIVVHPERSHARELATLATKWLRANGHDVQFTQSDAAQLGFEVATTESFGPGLDLIISLGGDGTMLRSVRLASAHDVNVLGVNVGHLGYLTEVEPSGLIESLQRYFNGDYRVERRMLLSVSATTQDGEEVLVTDHGLNEAVIEKTTSGHTVRLSLALNGEHFTTYMTDGLIVATPTGSTAYSFSARGPIVDPKHRALVITPVAPHMLFDRALVLDPDTTVTISVADLHEASLSVDGRPLGIFARGSMIHCRASEHEARLVNFGLRQFHSILKAKFGLNDR